MALDLVRGATKVPMLDSGERFCVVHIQGGEAFLVYRVEIRPVVHEHLGGAGIANEVQGGVSLIVGQRGVSVVFQ